MSIADSAQAASLGKVPSKQRQHRIRRGQKLDEIVSLSELRLDEFGPSSSSSDASSVFNASSSSSFASGSGGDSPFQLQEYLSLLVRRDPHAVETIVALPTSPADDDDAFQNVDTDIWVYEQLRRLVLDLTTPWLTSLQLECDKFLRPTTCAAMNAGDWMYLCASHGEEKQCCAIDYMVHTLDGATSLLNSARHFPSRTYVPNTSLRHFGSIARRLSRIFVHGWCYHRETFMACEAETSLYARFLTLVETYDLTATDNLPPRPGHASSTPSSNTEGKAGGYEAVDEAAEFSRAPFTLNGTTAKRERSGTAAMRSSLVQALGQSPFQLPPKHEVDAVGLVPPPAPSPRATAVLSRPEHEEGEDGPEWTSIDGRNEGDNFLPGGQGHEQHDDEDDEEEDEDEEEGVDADDRTQKINTKEQVDDDTTISTRATVNGLEEEEKEMVQAVVEATESGETPGHSS